MENIYYFPQISAVTWASDLLTTCPNATCLTLTCRQPPKTKSHLTHCATALQGYLCSLARRTKDDKLWIAALSMTTSPHDGDCTAQIDCPSLPTHWGEEMGGFQRFAIAITQEDTPLRVQSLWRAFLCLDNRESCVRFLYETVGNRIAETFLNYVSYLAVDPDLRVQEGWGAVPPTPISDFDALLDCWTAFYRQYELLQ